MKIKIVSSCAVALALGVGVGYFDLGFIGGGDTHDGHPGIGSPGMPPPGLAGLYVEHLSRDAILGALEIDDRGFIPEFSVFATNPF